MNRKTSRTSERTRTGGRKVPADWLPPVKVEETLFSALRQLIDAQDSAARSAGVSLNASSIADLHFRAYVIASVAALLQREVSDRS
jgi:hypothetical protein